jgi:hypothetical protein
MEGHMQIHKTVHSVQEMGYFDQKTARDAIIIEENRAIAEGIGIPRCSELREVAKFMNLYRQGIVLSVTLRNRSFRGTLLGYRRHQTRGWVMGILKIKSGKIKDVTIDPKGYAILDGLIDMMEDREAKYISLVTSSESMLQISPFLPNGVQF